jgi:hydroxymethylbilane synthase
MSPPPPPGRRALRAGTRSSPMARAQTRHVVGLLERLDPALRVETIATTTAGDTWPGDLAQLGGKGLFVKALDAQLQRGETDFVVHCLKDLPGDRPLPDGLTLAAVLPRADVHDVLVVPGTSRVTALADLPESAVVATSAVRRAAQLLALRPDLSVRPVRGTVGTRLAKLDAHDPPAPLEPRPGDSPGAGRSAGPGNAQRTAGRGQFGRSPLFADAMVLARAGLERLGLTARIRYQFTLDEMQPAAGAGILALLCRQGDEATTGLLRQLDDPATHAEAHAERSLLHGLQGHCNSPIAAHCTTGPDGRLTLRAAVFTDDGSRFVHARHSAAPGEDPAALGSRVCAELARQGARHILGG